MWLAWLAACGLFDKTKAGIDNLNDQIAGITEGTVLQGSVLGVQQPDDDAVTALIAATDFAPGTSALAYIADAASADEISSGLVTGAAVDVEGTPFVEEEGEDGLYTLDPAAGPPYDVGATWTLTVDRGDGPRTATVDLPAPAEGVLDATGPGGSVVHAANTPLTVDLTGRGYNSALIVVIGPDGTPTFTNEPTSAQDLYDLSQSQDAGAIEVPGSAFPSNGTYAVGVAGLANDKGEDFDGFNTVLSKVRAGQMVFAPLVAGP